MLPDCTNAFAGLLGLVSSYAVVSSSHFKVGILSYQPEVLPVGHRIRVSAGHSFSRQPGSSRARSAGIQNAFILATLLFVVFAFGLVAQAQTMSTVAGGGPPNGVTAISAPIGNPWGIVQDSSGNTYVSDNLTNRIFKIDTSGNLSVVVGNGVKFFSGDGGAATLATLSGPEGLAIDANGVIYIADTGNHVIRAFNASSTTSVNVGNTTIGPLNIATVAGTGTQPCTSPTSACGDGAKATLAQLNLPGGVAIDSSGNIFIADTQDNKIREVTITTNGFIQTVAGTGTAGAVIPGPATSSPLNAPAGVYVDTTGNLFIADTVNNQIEQVTTGTLSTIAATAGQLNTPNGVFVDTSGNIFIADSLNNEIKKVSGGVLSIVAGDGTACGPSVSPTCDDGPLATSAELNSPSGIFVNSATGNFWIADQNDNAIRAVASSAISIFAGEYFNAAFYGDGGAPTSAELLRPIGMVLDSSGNLLVADSQNNAIRKIPTSGNISTVAGTGVFCNTLSCGDGGLASLPAAMLASPSDVALDAAGNIYIADTQDHAIRVVNTTASDLTFYSGTANETIVHAGDIQTIVGTISTICPASPCGDNNAATLATLNNPGGLFLDGSGNIYVADTGDNVIRFVNTQPAGTPAIDIAGVSVAPGNIATIAGNYTPCAVPTGTNPCGDTGAATAANLNAPASVFVDTAGNIYITDTQDNRIRVVNPQASSAVTVAGVTISAGDINTIVGDGIPNYSGDGHIGTLAEINFPGGVFVSSTNIFIADKANSVIRVVNSTSGNIQTAVGNTTTGFTGDGMPPLTAELALPVRVISDASSNLYIADASAQRIRKLSNLLSSPPIAVVSPAGSLPFVNQALETTSAPQTVTVSNTGIGASLAVSSVTITGTNAADFKQTNTCTSPVAAGTACTITVTFTPTAAGSRSATLTVTDNSSTGSTQSLTLSGTAVLPFTLPTTGTLSPSSVTAGSSATGTVTVSWQGNSTATVTLSCSVTPAETDGPTCSLSPSSVTPKSGTASSTLTVSTTSKTTSGALQPAIFHGQGSFAATWLFLPAMVLSTAGIAGSKKRKTLLCVLLILAVAGCIFLVACGGSSGNNTSGNGTPSGTYTITVTATAAGMPTQTEPFKLTVK